MTELDVAPRWHTNKKGDPGLCSAPIGNCPLSQGEEGHKPTAEAARAAYEVKMRREQAKTKLTNKKYIGNGPRLDIDFFPYGDYVAPDGSLWRYEGMTSFDEAGNRSPEMLAKLSCVAGKDAGATRIISKVEGLEYRLLISQAELEVNLAELANRTENHGLPEDEMAQGFNRSRELTNRSVLNKLQVLEENGATLAVGKNEVMKDCIMVRGVTSTLPNSMANDPKYKNNVRYKEDVVVFVPNVQRLSKKRAEELGEMLYVLEGNRRETWADKSQEARHNYIYERVKKIKGVLSISSRDGDGLISYTSEESGGLLRSNSTYIIKDDA